MSILQKIRAAIDSPTAQQVSTFLEDPEARPFTPDDSYLRLTLTDMSLGKAMQWFKAEYPSVTATVSLEFAGVTQAFTTVAGPPKEMLGPGVFVNYPLSPLLPYRGGVVQLSAGLVALKGSSGLKVMLDVLAGFSSLVAPPLGAAVRVASKLDDGIGRLLDSAGSVVLGMHDGYVAPTEGAGNILRGGYLAIVRADANKFDEKQLSVDGSRLKYAGQELDGYDYMLFHIESRQDRGESWAFPDLQALLNEAKRRKLLDDDNGFEDVRKQLLAAIVTSPDFTEADRWIVADKAEAQLNKLKKLADGASIAAVPTLEDALLASRMDLEDAIGRPPITLDALLN